MYEIPTTEKMSMLDAVVGSSFNAPTGAFANAGGDNICTPTAMPAGLVAGMKFWSKTTGVRNITAVTATNFTVDGAAIAAQTGDFGIVWAMSGELDNCVLRLFNTNIVPSVNTQLSDLTTCTFSGYADIPLTFGKSFFDVSTGVAQSWAGSVQFTHDGGPNADTAYIWGVVQLTPTPKLIMSEAITPPKQFATATDAMVIMAAFDLGQTVDAFVSA